MKEESGSVFSPIGAYSRMSSPTRLLFRSSRPSSRFGRTFTHIGAWFFISILIYYSYGPIYNHFATITDNQDVAAVADEPLIPRKIWQIYLSPPTADRETYQIQPSSLSETPSWIALNPGYDYNLVGDKQAEKILDKYYKDNTTLVKTFHDLKNTGMKSDVMRYLLLNAEGGVYADTDVTALKPVDKWVPEEYRNATRAVVGIEFDRLDGENWGEVHPDIQICSWTLAATPGHPIYASIAEKVVTGLKSYTAQHNTTLAEMNIPDADVLELTGPMGWTDVVFKQLQEYDPDLTDIRNLTGITSPRLIGDILILPIDGFGMGQQHSNSTNDGSIPENAYVLHNFEGTWRHDNEKPEDQKPGENQQEQNQQLDSKPQETRPEENLQAEKKPEEITSEENLPQENLPQENKPESIPEQSKQEEIKHEENKQQQEYKQEEHKTEPKNPESNIPEENKQQENHQEESKPENDRKPDVE